MNPLDRHRCQLCHQPAGQNASCSCPVDCGDLMCRMAPLPFEPLPPAVPRFCVPAPDDETTLERSNG